MVIEKGVGGGLPSMVTEQTKELERALVNIGSGITSV